MLVITRKILLFTKGSETAETGRCTALQARHDRTAAMNASHKITIKYNHAIFIQHDNNVSSHDLIALHAILIAVGNLGTLISI